MRRRELLGGLGAASLGALAGCPAAWRPDSNPDPSPGDGGRSLATRDRVLYVDDEPFVPTGVYYWPDVSRSLGRNPFEDIASYGLNAVTARYQYVRLDDDRVRGQPDVDELRAAAERLGLYYLLESPPSSELAGRSERNWRACSVRWPTGWRGRRTSSGGRSTSRSGGGSTCR